MKTKKRKIVFEETFNAGQVIVGKDEVAKWLTVDNAVISAVKRGKYDDDAEYILLKIELP